MCVCVCVCVLNCWSGTRNAVFVRRIPVQESPLCELFITCMHNKSSWYSFERRMTIKPSAFLRCAAKCAWQGISPIFSAFTIRRIFTWRLFIDTNKRRPTLQPITYQQSCIQLGFSQSLVPKTHNYLTRGDITCSLSLLTDQYGTVQSSTRKKALQSTPRLE